MKAIRTRHVEAMPEVIAKEPWQVTREVYVESARQWRAENMPRLTGRALEHELEQVGKGHREIIRRAFIETGKPVQPEVLVDYPDLLNLKPRH